MTLTAKLIIHVINITKHFDSDLIVLIVSIDMRILK